MQTNLLWSSREYHSLENCLVNVEPDGTVVTSTIIGYYKGKIYQAEYRLVTDRQWRTVLLEITTSHDNQVQNIRLEGDGRGNWTTGGKEATAFSGCIDVDIPLTPFTNTLPINRLRLTAGQSAEIGVIYCDVLNQKVTAVRQRYTCLSAEEYHYENVPNDFEANIRIDVGGFVVDYPDLFVRTAAIATNYPPVK